MKKSEKIVFYIKTSVFVSVVYVCIIFGMVCEAMCDENHYVDTQKQYDKKVQSYKKDIEDNNSFVEEDDELTSIIRRSFKKKITFDIDVYPTLSKAALEIAYDRSLVLEGRGDDYSLFIYGEDIEDYNNELDMKIYIKKINEKIRGVKDGYVITRKLNNELPGKVVIKIRNKKLFKNNVYMHNKNKGSYDLLNVKNMTWQLDKDVTYIITNKDINEKKVDYNILIYVAVAIVMLMVIYVLVKKKYWFW